MEAVHAASHCEKTTLPLQKRNLKPKEYNSNNKRGDWLNAQVSKFRLLLFYAFSRQLRVSNYDISWTNQNARYKSSLIREYETLSYQAFTLSFDCAILVTSYISMRLYF